MAVQTKTISANGSKGHHRFTLTVNEERTSDNSSFMSYSLVLSPIQSGWDWANWGSQISYSITIGSNTYTGIIPNYNGSSTITLNSGSNIEIPHDTDGTKTINISFSVTDNTGQNYTCGNASASDNFKLSDLHKAPTLTLSSVSENSSKLSGVDGTTFVNNISEKTFTLNYSLFDSATPSSLKIYDKNGNEFLNPTVVLGNSSGTIKVNFKNTPLSNNVIVGNKTTFAIKFTDSKGGAITITTPEYTIIPYSAPNLIPTASNVKRNGQTTGKAILNLSGQFYNATIGNTTNAVTLSFKYWTGSTEPSTYYTIPSSANTGSGNNITVSKWEFKKNNVVVVDLDKSNSYKFKIRAIDSFGSEYESIIELTLAKGEWLMAKFKNRVDFKKITIDGYNPFEYSDEETICGVWVENGEEKPIYRKVFTGTSSTADGVTIDLTSINADIIINAYGWVKSQYNNWWPIDNYYPPEPGYATSVSYSSSDIGIYCGSYFSYPEYRIILEYKKTTD